MPHEHDPEPESPQIPARPVMLSLGIGAVVIALSMAGLGAWYGGHAPKAPALTSFPEPRLEAFLQRTPLQAPAAPLAPAMSVEDAMAKIVARGPMAYDPPAGDAP